ncbi:MAG: type II toxin-antitoxin system Phd/YefM family antitoxin [bacterium]|nr:type II toxin-antitoxin system Phd/YefM family antitoxin [bacterium]
MKTAALTETKNNLSVLIDQVRHGETILVLDRGRPETVAAWGGPPGRVSFVRAEPYSS